MSDLRGYLNSLCEPGGSRAYGVWAEGHVSHVDFATAVRDEYQREATHHEVRHVYYRVLRGIMHFTSRKGRGATPATLIEW